MSMKKCFLMVALVLSMCLYFLSSVTQAQEAADTAKPQAQVAEPPATEGLEETEFSYGTVKSVAGDQLVVSEYDYDQDQDVDVTYTVPPDAQLENVKSVSEIAAGDIVDIDFLVRNGQKTASLITVEKPAGEEDEDIALEEEKT